MGPKRTIGSFFLSAHLQRSASENEGLAVCCCSGNARVYSVLSHSSRRLLINRTPDRLPYIAVCLAWLGIGRAWKCYFLIMCNSENSQPAGSLASIIGNSFGGINFSLLLFPPCLSLNFLKSLKALQREAPQAFCPLICRCPHGGDQRFFGEFNIQGLIATFCLMVWEICHLLGDNGIAS